MASPLTWIRKNQKVMMAVFGITLIGVFLVTLVIPSGPMTSGPTGRIEDPVVVKWKDGQLHASEVQVLRARHYQLMSFLEALYTYATNKKKGAVQMRVRPIEPLAQSSLESAEEDVVTRFIIAQRAAQDGIVITDGMVDEYLALLVGDVQISHAEMDAVNRGVNERVDLKFVREQLKLELAKRQMDIMLSPASNFPMNPTQAAQYYTMVTRMIECEVLPIKVEDYISKVTSTPTDAELSKIYEKGKAHFPDNMIAKPGFKRNRKINLQYFSADFDTFLTNEVNKLTDKEVQEEYDRRVKANDKMIMEEIKPDLPGVNDKPSDSSEPLPGEIKPPESGVPADSSNQLQPMPSDSDKQAEGTPSTDQAPKKDDGKQNDDNGDTQQTTPESSEKKDGQSVTLIGDQQFVSTPLHRTQETEKAPEKPSEQQPSTENPQEQAKPEGSDAPPIEPPKTSDEPAQTEQQAPATGDMPADQTGDQPAGDVANPAAESPQEPVMRIKTLQEVADQLKKEMKSKAAEEAMAAAIESAEAELREFQAVYIDWKMLPEKKRGPEPTFDADAVAARHQLACKSTGLIAVRDLENDPFGKLTKMFIGEQNGQRVPSFVNVAQIVAANFAGMELYEPRLFDNAFSMSAGPTTTSVLFWPIEKVDASIPTFADAKPDLVEYWKREQAIELARAEGRRIAESIEQSGKKLAEEFGEKAVMTGQFPWYAGDFGSFEYFAVPGVTNPGEEFMRTAFGLEQGKVGVAANESRDTVYVICLVNNDVRTTPELMKQFSDALTPQKPFPQNVTAVANNYAVRIVAERNNQFVDDMKIEWLGR